MTILKLSDQHLLVLANSYLATTTPNALELGTCQYCPILGLGNECCRCPCAFLNLSVSGHNAMEETLRRMR